MLGYIGFGLFGCVWFCVARYCCRPDAGGFRRHMTGFCVAFFVELIYIMVVGDPPRSKQQTSAAPTIQVARADAASMQPSLKVSAEKLFQAYDVNEVAADQKYKGRWLTVSGTLDSIERTSSGQVMLRLRTANNVLPVIAFLIGGNDDWVQTAKKGQRAAFTCWGVGKGLGSPILKSCDVND